MAPITKENKHHGEPSIDCQQLIKQLVTVPDKDICSVLSNYTIWPFKRGDLHHWIPVLNRFDSLLLEEANHSKYYASFNTTLVLCILNFSRLLLESCTNRTIYNSYEHLNQLLMCHDLVVIEQVLLFLLRPIHRISSQRYKAPIHLSIKRLQALNPLLGVLDTYHQTYKRKSVFTFTRTPMEKQFILSTLQQDPITKKRKSTRKRQASLPTIPTGLITIKLNRKKNQTPLQQYHEVATQYYLKSTTTTNSTEYKDAIEAIELTSYQLYIHIISLYPSNAHQLLKLKLLSTCLLNHLNHDPNEPHFISQLLNLIHLLLSNPISSLLYYACYCLESVSTKHTLESSLLLKLFNHCQLLVQAHESIATSDIESSLYFIDSVFVLLTHCIYNNATTQLEPLVVPMLHAIGSTVSSTPAVSTTLGTVANDTTTNGTTTPTLLQYMLLFRSCHLLDILMYSHTDYIQQFKDNNGVLLLINSIVTEINRPQSIYHSITLKCQLKWLQHLISQINPRQLIESQLQPHLHLLLKEDDLKTQLMLFITTLLHLDPTVYLLLNDLPELLLKSLHSIPIQSECLQSLPNYIAAICLHSTGIELVLTTNILHSLLQTINNTNYTTSLLELDCAKQLGLNLEELCRHQPVLLSFVVDELQLVNQQLINTATNIESSILVYSKVLSGFFQTNQFNHHYLPKGLLVLQLYQCNVSTTFPSSKSSYFLSHVIHTWSETHLDVVLESIVSHMMAIPIDAIDTIDNSKAIAWYGYTGLLSDIYSPNQLTKLPLNPLLITRLMAIHYKVLCTTNDTTTNELKNGLLDVFSIPPLPLSTINMNIHHCSTAILLGICKYSHQSALVATKLMTWLTEWTSNSSNSFNMNAIVHQLIGILCLVLLDEKGFTSTTVLAIDPFLKLLDSLFMYCRPSNIANNDTECSTTLLQLACSIIKLSSVLDPILIAHIPYYIEPQYYLKVAPLFKSIPFPSSHYHHLIEYPFTNVQLTSSQLATVYSYCTECISWCRVTMTYTSLRTASTTTGSTSTSTNTICPYPFTRIYTEDCVIDYLIAMIQLKHLLTVPLDQYYSHHVLCRTYSQYYPSSSLFMDVLGYKLEFNSLIHILVDSFMTKELSYYLLVLYLNDQLTNESYSLHHYTQSFHHTCPPLQFKEITSHFRLTIQSNITLVSSTSLPSLPLLTSHQEQLLDFLINNQHYWPLLNELCLYSIVVKQTVLAKLPYTLSDEWRLLMQSIATPSLDMTPAFTTSVLTQLSQLLTTSSMDCIITLVYSLLYPYPIRLLPIQHPYCQFIKIFISHPLFNQLTTSNKTSHAMVLKIVMRCLQYYHQSTTTMIDFRVENDLVYSTSTSTTVISSIYFESDQSMTTDHTNELYGNDLHSDTHSHLTTDTIDHMDHTVDNDLDLDIVEHTLDPLDTLDTLEDLEDAMNPLDPLVDPLSLFTPPKSTSYTPMPLLNRIATRPYTYEYADYITLVQELPVEQLQQIDEDDEDDEVDSSSSSSSIDHHLLMEIPEEYRQEALMQHAIHQALSESSSHSNPIPKNTNTIIDLPYILEEPFIKNLLHSNTHVPLWYKCMSLT